MKKEFAFLFIILSSAISVSSQYLQIGMPAPILRTGEWIKGKQIQNFERGKIYVIEFWATWCGPCIEAMPHLSMLSQKYKASTEFIGISVAENNTNKVVPFVKKMGSKMAYSVAIDEQQSDTARKGYMTETYLRPLGINGIPATVVVGKSGLIEWVGNPMDLEYVLQSLSADRWDVNMFRKQLEAKAPLDSIMKVMGKNPDWNLIRQNLEKEYSYLSIDSIILSWQVSHYLETEDYPNYARTLIVFINRYDPKVNPDFLNRNAWSIFKVSNNKNELQSAARWLESELVSNDPFALDTYANIMFKLGNKNKAVAVQSKALEMIGRNEMAEDLALNYYKILTGEPTWKAPDAEFYSNNNRAWLKVRKSLTQYYGFERDNLIHKTKIAYMKKAEKWVDLTNEIVAFSNKNSHLMNGWELNSSAWDLFTYHSDTIILKKALEWSKKSLADARYKDQQYSFYDTYANILHKLGRSDEAVMIMQKAIELSPQSAKERYKGTLAKIQNGEKTWMVPGDDKR